MLDKGLIIAYLSSIFTQIESIIRYLFLHTNLVIKKGGGCMLNGVTCTVSNCNYWRNGEHCDASAIEVNVDGNGKVASQSQQTNCKTFHQK